MKTILAITLGTRDIQIRLSALEANGWVLDRTEKSIVVRQSQADGLVFTGYLPQGFSDTFCFLQPRTAGQLITQQYETILPILHFPLLQPVVDFLIARNQPPDYLFLLCTDQQEEYEAGQVKPKDYQNDTLYFADVVATHLQQYLSLTDEQMEIYKVTHGVTNMDYLYTHFATQGSKFFATSEAEIEKIFLLPQGGIDHINQAFTLKLIQQFGEKVMQLQQAEGQEPKQLNFPRLFLNDLYRQRRLQHLHDFEFGLLAQSINPGHKAMAVVRRLAQWADAKLHQRFDSLQYLVIQMTPKLSKQKPELVPWLQAESADTPMLRLQALTTMCYIQWQQGNTTDMLWRLFTLAENLFKVLVEQMHNWPDTSSYYIPGLPPENNEAWEKFLGEARVQLLRENNILVTNPNRFAFQLIYLDTIKNEKDQWEQKQRLIQAINHLASKRNKLAHHLKPVHAQEVNEVLLQYDLDVISLLDAIAQMIALPKPNFAERVQQVLLTFLR